MSDAVKGEGRFGYDWHVPQFYRYVVSLGVRRWYPRIVLNRYPGCLIGACVVVGRWAYCVKWSNVGARR